VEPIPIPGWEHLNVGIGAVDPVKFQEVMRLNYERIHQFPQYGVAQHLLSHMMNPQIAVPLVQPGPVWKPPQAAQSYGGNSGENGTGNGQTQATSTTTSGGYSAAAAVEQYREWYPTQSSGKESPGESPIKRKQGHARQEEEEDAVVLLCNHD
jgi:hypothetical protein